MSSLQKFSSHSRLPEMRLFWIFLPFLIVLLGIDFFYLPKIWILISAAVFLILSIIIFRNNLSLARSNLEIKVERSELQSIIGNLEDGVIAYDPDFKILIFNKSAEGIFNLKSEEVVNQRFAPSFAEESRFGLLAQVIFPSLAPMVIQRRESGVFPQITDFSFDDPRIELRVMTDRIYDVRGGLLGFVKIVHDRTREVRMSQSKNEFISVAAHQLRTPLSAIHWAFEALVKEPLSSSQKEVVEGGFNAAVKLLKIVNDLLDVSRIEEGKFGYNFEEVNISDFIKRVVADTQGLYPQSSVKVYFKSGLTSPLMISIDPEKMRIVLANLLDNAIKYNVENGEVIVSSERLKDAPYVQISVKDTGVGIPSEDLNKAFTKFFRGENASKLVTEGTGLGLYIVKNIIRRHGGEIRVESELNRGTTFYFTLPTDSSLIPTREMEGFV